MRPYLVCNPGSRNRRGAAAADAYRRALDARGVEYGVGVTGTLDDAAALARAAAASGYSPVVAVGGDGTINRVLNGLMAPTADRGAASFGVLYAGTSPDFCRFHGLPTGGEEAVDCLLSGRNRAVDLCRIRYRGPDGAEVVSHFSCSANLGLGPAVASWSNGHRKWIGDFGGTLLATLLAILRGRRFSGVAAVDGSEAPLRGVWNLTVGKNPLIASGLRLSTGVGPADGRLYLFALHSVGRLGFLAALPAAYSGTLAADPRFTLLCGQRATFRSEGLAPGLEFDGDPAGTAPLEVEVLPGAIDLVGAST